MADAWTDITYLDVRLLTGVESAYVYGNGRHQAAVVVSFVPSNKTKNVQITDQELGESVTLIDYVTGDKLAGKDGWVVSTQDNGFDGGLGASGLSGPQPNANGVYQFVAYVSCTPDARPRARTIGVKIKPTDGPAVNSAMHGDWNSSVFLSALEPIQYKFGVNVNAYALDVPRGVSTAAGPSLRQINYYLCIDNAAEALELLYIYKADISGTGFFFGWTSGTPSLKVAVMWPPGPQGMDTSTDIPIPYNQRAQELCITLLTADMSSTGEQVNTPATVTIYDQYGNAGTFNARPTGNSSESDFGDGILLLSGAA